MATEDEIYNMGISLSKTGVSANLTEALALAKTLLEHQEEKTKLKEELKIKDQQERESKMKTFTLPPVRLGVDGDIDLTRPLSELLNDSSPLAVPKEFEHTKAPLPELTTQSPLHQSNAPVSLEQSTKPEVKSVSNEQSQSVDLFSAFKAK